MTNDFLLIASVGCLLWVFRVPITFFLCMGGVEICESLGLEYFAGWFAVGVNHCFYYHPEWCPNQLSEEELEEWKERFEDANLN